ncbi:MAG TPA: 2-amino-4-hydroxy-6-hydroxymethyldihydropteridine diphosphokinase [Bacteroidales bacterium]|nr:2-amino-4-hydroxy-6-hydroxymethyldihydropteridine diphosphokinase [Bacteroidales bacterium]HRR94202.1 2-amino-4-hydroxy-6-hydroxymethyldihydropteridine diphosphokinase [Bacteroidales bacterium]HRT90308.1 2-amino-4-hydroxy-6-hydroxymethyldihydropteridine diphosphokinase [Bacteroidales bacterium]
MGETVYLGMGSNLGDRLENIRRAVDLCRTSIGVLLESSAIYETTPWGFDCDRNFYNSVIRMRSTLEPEEILNRIKDIENLFGRRKTRSGYEPRVIDIDILLYGTRVINSPGLTIPHKHLPYRKFVLVPLQTLAPGFVHPLSGKTIRELLEACPDRGIVTPVAAI